jgi:hypothetical protein
MQLGEVDQERESLDKVPADGIKVGKSSVVVVVVIFVVFAAAVPRSRQADKMVPPPRQNSRQEELIADLVQRQRL